MKSKSGGANKPPDEKVSALRLALRSAPRKVGGRSRSPLQVAVAQLLPDLLAFRAKGYSDAELAGVMRDNGFVIAASTLRKYLNEARGRSGKARKKKAEKVAPASALSKAITVESGFEDGRCCENGGDASFAIGDEASGAKSKNRKGRSRSSIR